MLEFERTVNYTAVFAAQGVKVIKIKKSTCDPKERQNNILNPIISPTNNADQIHLNNVVALSTP